VSASETLQKVVGTTAFADGSVALDLEYEDGSHGILRLSDDAAGRLVAAICHAKAAAGAAYDRDDPPGGPPEMFGPIRCSAVGVGQASADASILMLSLFGFALGFEIPNSELGELARSALTISASNKPT